MTMYWYLQVLIQVGPIKFTSLAVGNASEEYRLAWVARSAYNVSMFHVLVTSLTTGRTITDLEVPPGDHSGNGHNERLAQADAGILERKR